MYSIITRKCPCASLNSQRSDQVRGRGDSVYSALQIYNSASRCHTRIVRRPLTEVVKSVAQWCPAHAVLKHALARVVRRVGSIVTHSNALKPELKSFGLYLHTAMK